MATVTIQQITWIMDGNPVGQTYVSKWFPDSVIAEELVAELYDKGITAKIVRRDESNPHSRCKIVIDNTKNGGAISVEKTNLFFKSFPGVTVAGLSHPSADEAETRTDVKPSTAQAFNHNAQSAGPGTIDETALEAALADIDALIGLDAAKKQMHQIVNKVRADIERREAGIEEPGARPCYHMAFLGNPGTGKTTFAQLTAKVFHALGIARNPDCNTATRDDLIGEYIGHTEPKVRNKVEEARGGVLFIDEAYALSNSGSDRDFGQQALDTLVPLMETYRDDLIVIFAGYKRETENMLNANTGLKSRCPFVITFEDYDSVALGQILDGMLKEKNRSITQDARAGILAALERKRVVDGERFGNGRSVRNIIDAVELALSHRLGQAESRKRREGLSPDEKKKALTTYMLEDVSPVSAAIKPPPEKRRMGF